MKNVREAKKPWKTSTVNSRILDFCRYFTKAVVRFTARLIWGKKVYWKYLTSFPSGRSNETPLTLGFQHWPFSQPAGAPECKRSSRHCKDMHPLLRHLTVSEARTGHLCHLTSVTIKATKPTLHEEGREASWERRTGKI